MKFWVSLSLLFIYSNLFASQILKDLNEAEVKSLKEKGILIYFKPTQSKYNQIVSYGILPTSAQNAAAIFANGNRQNEYVPNLINSKINHLSFMKTEVLLELELPFPLDTETFSLLYQYEISENLFKGSWKLGEHQRMKFFEGYAILEKFENDQSIFKYVNFIDPGITLATKDKVNQDMKNMVIAYRNEVIKTSKNQEKLKKDFAIYNKITNEKL